MKGEVANGRTHPLPLLLAIQDIGTLQETEHPPLPGIKMGWRTQQRQASGHRCDKELISLLKNRKTLLLVLSDCQSFGAGFKVTSDTVLQETQSKTNQKMIISKREGKLGSFD